MLQHRRVVCDPVCGPICCINPWLLELESPTWRVILHSTSALPGSASAIVSQRPSATSREPTRDRKLDHWAMVTIIAREAVILKWRGRRYKGTGFSHTLIAKYDQWWNWLSVVMSSSGTCRRLQPAAFLLRRSFTVPVSLHSTLERSWYPFLCQSTMLWSESMLGSSSNGDAPCISRKVESCQGSSSRGEVLAD